MTEKPFKEIMYCPITERNEEVFFYVVQVQGKPMLRFMGCDHQFHESNAECQICHKEAFQKLINRT